MSREIRWKEAQHHWELYVMVLPTILLVGLFQYYPAVSGIFHSFYRWNGSDVSEFVGLRNYGDLLTSPPFWQSFNVALVLGLWNVVKMIPSIAVAVWIHRCRSSAIQFIYRLLFVIPMVIPALVMALIWRSFFSKLFPVTSTGSSSPPVFLVFCATLTNGWDGAEFLWLERSPRGSVTPD